MNTQKIGFDFDKVFVDYPPFIPTSVIDLLYKKRNGYLSYRTPGTIEKHVRVLSHTNLLRHPIRKNINALARISQSKNIETYVISSRFSFLKKRTEEWDNKNKISRYFKKMYFNFDDEQPHLFKERILKEEHIDKFIDDDLDLLFFLSKRNPSIKFYWITPEGKGIKLPKNVTKIRDLDEFLKKYV